jgi:hypothetical protein
MSDSSRQLAVRLVAEFNRSEASDETRQALAAALPGLLYFR